MVELGTYKLFVLKEAIFLPSRRIITSHRCQALFLQAQRARQRRKYDLVRNNELGLKSYVERTFCIILPRRYSIFTTSFPNISAHLSDLRLKISIPTQREETQLESHSAVGRNNKTNSNC